MQKNNKTTLLPQRLLDKIKETSAEDDHQTVKRTKKRGPSRKDARKQDRDAKKQRKAENHTARHRPVEAQTPKLPHGVQKRGASSGSREQDAPRKKPRLVEGASSPPARDTLDSPPPQPVSKTQAPKSKTPVVPRPATSLTIDNLIKPKQDIEELQEAKKISWLESQLGIKKASRGSKSRYGADFADDGLDDLLMDVDRILESTSAGASASVQIIANSDEEDDELNVGDDQLSSLGDEDDNYMHSDFDDSDEESEAQLGKAVREDDEEAPTLLDPAPSEAQSSNRYVPPHLRVKPAEDTSAETIKLKRQMKGLLNRMSEQNIENLLNEFLALYRTNRRYDVTTTLTTLIIEGISSHASLLDSYVILHATLVASLHKLVGIDFAAHFVEACIASYESHYASLDQGPTDSDSIPLESDDAHMAEVIVQGKECMNIIVLVSELYNFQVISCVLVYDLIRGLLSGDELKEMDVELLMKITRNSGPQLRIDDPLALKDIVQLVQLKVADKNPRSLSSRIRFMIETLTNLKNNKTKSTANSQASGSDSVTRLRKFLSGLSKKHHILAHEPLRVSLEDLHSADKKGKWWLVGAAWGGDPLVDARQKQQAVAAPSAALVLHNDENDALVKLARKQGMNTDVRRSIFVVLMSSDDYVDACERLGQLGLNEVQQREIVRVLTHCCGNEKSYNPYYTLVGQQLCRTSHSVQVTLQYCLWDFLRDLGESDVGGAEMVKSLQTGGEFDGKKKDVPLSKIHNVAMAYAWWVAKGCTTLGILKAVDLSALHSAGQTFFNAFFTQLFLSTQSQSPVLAYTSTSPDAIPNTTSKERKALELLVLKVTAQNPALAQGIYMYVSRAHLEKMGKTEGMKRFVGWAVEVLKETIKIGMDVSAEL